MAAVAVETAIRMVADTAMVDMDSVAAGTVEMVDMLIDVVHMTINRTTDTAMDMASIDMVMAMGRITAIDMAMVMIAMATQVEIDMVQTTTDILMINIIIRFRFMTIISIDTIMTGIQVLLETIIMDMGDMDMKDMEEAIDFDY